MSASMKNTLIVAALLVLFVLGYVIYIGGASGDTHTHTAPAITTTP